MISVSMFLVAQQNNRGWIAAQDNSSSIQSKQIHLQYSERKTISLINRLPI